MSLLPYIFSFKRLSKIKKAGWKPTNDLSKDFSLVHLTEVNSPPPPPNKSTLISRCKWTDNWAQRMCCCAFIGSYIQDSLEIAYNTFIDLRTSLFIVIKTNAQIASAIKGQINNGVFLTHYSAWLSGQTRYSLYCIVYWSKCNLPIPYMTIISSETLSLIQVRFYFPVIVALGRVG